ncbi:MAG: PAS domain S-box protein [Desulfobacteraceae bacterium]|nr:PAS domain S-box protein [Desulfobacteraceae bacterium]
MEQPATIPELERRVEELAAINQLTGELTVNLSKDSFMDSVYRKVRSILKPDLTLVYRINNNRLLLQGDPSKHNTVHHDSRKQLMVGECLCGLVAKTGEAIFCREICKDPRCTRTECMDAGLCSFAALPLVFDNTLSGVLGIAATEKRSFEEQKDFLEIVSGNIAMAIDIARLYEKLSQSNRKLTAELSKRRKTETALRKSRQHLAKAQEIAHFGTWRLDLATREVVGSKELFNIFGLPGEKGCLDNFSSLVHPEDRERDRYHIKRGMKTGEPWDIEYRINTGDGRLKHIHGKGEAVRDKTGKIVELVGTVQDITPRKKAEFLLKEREQVYRSMFENNTSVMLLINPVTGAIIDANPSACAFYGHAKDRLTKMNITDINTLSPEEIHAEMENSGSEKRNYFNFRHRAADGIIRDVEVYSGPISVSGKPLLCSIIHDISHRKQVEKEREQLIGELRNSVQEIKTLRGFLPICSSCMKIRDDQGYWNRIESYIERHSQALFSHSICPACMDKLYGEEEWYIKMKERKKNNPDT